MTQHCTYCNDKLRWYEEALCSACDTLGRDAEWLGIPAWRLEKLFFFQRIDTPSLSPVEVRAAVINEDETLNLWLGSESGIFRLRKTRTGRTLIDDGVARGTFLEKELPFVADLFFPVYYRKSLPPPYPEPDPNGKPASPVGKCEFCDAVVYTRRSKRCHTCRGLLEVAYVAGLYSQLMQGLKAARTAGHRGEEVRMVALNSDIALQVRFRFYLAGLGLYFHYGNGMPYKFVKNGKLWLELGTQEVPSMARVMRPFLVARRR